MITKREVVEYFIIAKLMSIWEGEGLAAYRQCKDFIVPDMFSNRRLRWVYKVICEMYEEGWQSTCEDDIGQYIIGKKKVTEEKVGSICCFLIEVYLRFCDITHPLTGVQWTMEDAVNELIKYSDGE